MQDLAANLSQYATQEVITVLAALFVAFLGWQAAKKTGSVIGGLAKKSSFMGLMSTLMVAGGLGLGGLGVGEIRSRSEAPHADASGLSNTELMELIKDDSVTTEELKLILEHAKHRDGVNNLSNEELITLIKDDSVDTEELKLILEHVAVRDTVTKKNAGVIPVSQTSPLSTEEDGSPFEINPYEPGPAVSNQESLMTLPFAWMTALMGLGLTITGVTCFSCRNAKRNTDDPHHPTYGQTA